MAKIKLLRAAAADATPPLTMEPGELAVDYLASPAHLWARTATGHIDLIEGVPTPVQILDGGTGASTASAALDNLSVSSGTTAGALQRTAAGVWSVASVEMNGGTFVSTMDGSTSWRFGGVGTLSCYA